MPRGMIDGVGSMRVAKLPIDVSCTAGNQVWRNLRGFDLGDGIVDGISS